MREMSLKAMLVVVSILFVCNAGTFGQTPQNTAPVLDSDGQSNNITDQDIEMLALTAQTDHRAEHDPDRR